MMLDRLFQPGLCARGLGSARGTVEVMDICLVHAGTMNGFCLVTASNYLFNGYFSPGKPLPFLGLSFPLCVMEREYCFRVFFPI